MPLTCALDPCLRPWPLPPPAVNRFALVRKLAWDATGLFNADAWDSYARS